MCKSLVEMVEIAKKTEISLKYPRNANAELWLYTYFPGKIGGSQQIEHENVL